MFQKATRKQLKLRLALVGPTGAGKTKSALLVAAGLGKRIAVIDTENRSASKFIGDPGVPDFDVCELESYAPQKYVEAIQFAERAGYDVIIVDGITQAWSGKDGALEMVDKAAKRTQSGNSFTAWRDVTPHHNALVEALVRCKAHLIVTMRAKMEYALEEGANGKKSVRKIGLAPVQREGMEYELDIVGDLDVDHNLSITKTRCTALDGAVIHKPGVRLAETLLEWLDEGEVEHERPLVQNSAPKSSPQQAHGSQTRPTSGQRSSASTNASASSKDAGQRRVDEFGLVMPLHPCPVVTKDGPNKGVPWSDLKGPLIEKMYAESGDRMTENGREWCEYILARRAARKAKEALDAEQAAAEAAFAAAEQTEPGASDQPDTQDAQAAQSTEAAQ